MEYIYIFIVRHTTNIRISCIFTVWKLVKKCAISWRIEL